MGNCWSTRIKAERLLHSDPTSGTNSKYVGKDGTGLSGSSSKVSAPSVPPTPQSEGEILQASNVKSFSFSELKSATRNFHPDSVLGEGGFGYVFKGWIDENTFAATKPGTGMVIAVKRLNQRVLNGHKEWLAEVNNLGQLYHANLVKLIGYCLEDDHPLLVYEFMPQGSLENHLFRRGSDFQPLAWSLRMKVALGAAKGLAFLHSAETKNYNAKLSGLGLAKDGPSGDESHVSTKVMGTYGYAAPEYLATGHPTAESDVYSFGVVLLEMLSGGRAVDKNRPSGQQNLVEWAKPYLTDKRKISRVLDFHLEGQYSLGAVVKAASLALQCLATEPKFRPTMDVVVAALEQLQETQDTTNGPTKTVADADDRNSGNHGHRSRGRSADEMGNTKASYPRPSSSPLFS